MNKLRHKMNDSLEIVQGKNSVSKQRLSLIISQINHRSSFDEEVSSVLSEIDLEDLDKILTKENELN